jgi:hypothetical protein
MCQFTVGLKAFLFGRKLKEELLFWIGERSHNAELTDKGCRQLAPYCPELFQVGDLVSALATIDSSTLSDGDKFYRRENPCSSGRQTLTPQNHFLGSSSARRFHTKSPMHATTIMKQRSSSGRGSPDRLRSQQIWPVAEPTSS